MAEALLHGIILREVTINGIKFIQCSSEYDFSLFNSSWHHLFYQQIISRLLWFWWISGLECTKYSMFPTFSEEGPKGPPQVSCCLLFVRGCLLYSLLKRLNVPNLSSTAWWDSLTVKLMHGVSSLLANVTPSFYTTHGRMKTS